MCIFGIIHYSLSKAARVLLRMLKVEKVAWEEIIVTGDRKQQVLGRGTLINERKSGAVVYCLGIRKFLEEAVFEVCFKAACECAEGVPCDPEPTVCRHGGRKVLLD